MCVHWLVSHVNKTKIYFLVHIIITVIYISTGLVGVVQCISGLVTLVVQILHTPGWALCQCLPGGGDGL